MAIIFLEQKNKKKYFYFATGAIIVALLIFMIIHFSNREVLPTIKPIEPKKIIIDWSVFDNPFLQKLEPPVQVPQPSTVPARENPFKEFVFPTSIPTLTPSTLTPSQ